MMSIKATQQRQLLAKDHTNDVARQLLDIEILYLLTPEPRSGYELKKHLLNLFHINISYGTLYPHLHSLEKSKLISGTWNSREPEEPMKKKMYSLTAQGSDKLRAGVEDLGKISLTMQFMLAGMTLSSNAPPPVEGSEEAFRIAERLLADHGYSTKRMALLRGASGFEYPVELYATKHDSGSSRDESLILKVVNPIGSICSDDLLRLYVIAYDLQVTQAIMLSASPVKDEVMKLATFYRIPVFHGKDLLEAASDMRTNFETP